MVMLQTAQADHSFFTYFTQGDIESFLQEQLQERKEFGYPPFTRLVALRFKHPVSEAALASAQQFAQELAKIGITHTSGPFASAHAPNAKLYTQLLWIHLPRHLKSEEVKQMLYHKVNDFTFSRGMVQVDVDPC